MRPPNACAPPSDQDSCVRLEAVRKSTIDCDRHSRERCLMRRRGFAVGKAIGQLTEILSQLLQFGRRGRGRLGP